MDMERARERITKKRVLLECKEIMIAQLKNWSRHQNGLEPAEGFEAPWELQREKVQVLEDIIYALESSTVEKAMAGWQTEVMERDRTGLPQEPLQTPEETIERQTMMEMRLP